MAAVVAFLLLAFYIGIATPLILFGLGVVIFTGNAIWQNRKCLISPIKSLGCELGKSPLFWIAIAALASFGVSSALGINPDKTVGKWSSIVVIAIGGLVWYLSLRRLDVSFMQMLPRAVYTVLIIVSAVYTLEAIVWKLSGFSLHSDRFILTMRKLGPLYSILAPFALIHIIRQDRILHWLGLMLITFVAFFCGGRSGALAYSFMLVMFAFFFPWGEVAGQAHAKIKRWGRCLFRYVTANILAAMAGIAGYVLMAGVNRFALRVASERAATGSGRTDIWAFTWERFLENPVLGIGVQGFRYLDFSQVKLSSISHPHNMFLELLLETGIIGTFLIGLFVVLVLFKSVYKAHRKDAIDPYHVRPLFLAAMIGVISFVLSAQFVTSFFHGWWLLYPTMLMVLLGAFTAIYKRSTSEFIAALPAPSSPVVSVVMPCHNGASFLEAAIESVRGQSYGNWELVIVNDGSEDGSRDIIDRYVAMDSRIRGFHHREAQGAGAARNTGLDNAKGRYVAFLDCDDLWKPEKLERQIAFMQERGAALSTTHYDVIDDSGKKVGVVTPRDNIFTFGRLLKCNDIGCSVAMIDTAQTGNVRFPDYRRAQDFVFWCEILRRGMFCVCLHDNLGQYRVHEKSRTANKIVTAKNRIRLLHEAIGVPFIVMPYYIALYILYGVSKQIRSHRQS